jgi:hypothetical protein
VTPSEFQERLARGEVLPLSAREWEDIASHFPVEERHQTQLAGELLIVRAGKDLVALEAPSPDARVARLLGDAAEARAFVQKRMEEYERMWDGCGVKVDYLGKSEL